MPSKFRTIDLFTMRGPAFMTWLTQTVKEKLADIFVIGVIAVSMWINTFDAVWHGFNNPEGFYYQKVHAFLQYKNLTA